MTALRIAWTASACGAKIEAVFAVDVVESDGDEQVVDVVAAEVGVAVGGDDFEDAFLQLEDGDVEGSAAEVVDGDDAFPLAVESVGERGCCGLVDQAQDFESGDAAGILGGLALGVVEIGRDGDDCLGDRRAEVALGVLLQLAQDVGGDLRRRVLLRANLQAEHFAGLDVRREVEGKELQLFLDVFDAAAHQALGGVDDAVGRASRDRDMRDSRRSSLASGSGMATTEGTRFETVFAGNDHRLIALHEGDERVGGAEIDSDDAGLPPYFFDAF